MSQRAFRRSCVAIGASGSLMGVVLAWAIGDVVWAAVFSAFLVLDVALFWLD